MLKSLYAKILIWIITIVGAFQYLRGEKAYWLLLVIIGLTIISLFEYKTLKKNNEITYQSLKLIFVYIIGSLFSLFLFICELQK